MDTPNRDSSPPGPLAVSLEQRLQDRIRQVDALTDEVNRLRAQRDRLHHLVVGLGDAVEAAVRRAQAPRGGQHVPFHGDFCNAPPSTLGRLRWWVQAFLEALEVKP